MIVGELHPEDALTLKEYLLVSPALPYISAWLDCRAFLPVAENGPCGCWIRPRER